MTMRRKKSKKLMKKELPTIMNIQERPGVM